MWILFLLIVGAVVVWVLLIGFLAAAAGFALASLFAGAVALVGAARTGRRKG